MFSYAQLLTGFLLGAALSLASWKSRALTRDGAVAAALLGMLIFGLGGAPWAGLLLVFFVTSSGLSRAFGRQKKGLEATFSKGSQRDWAQVMANGGVGAALVILQALLPDQRWPWYAYAGSLAAVTADTWATEIGALSKTPPRLITTGKPVEKGVSGGVTPTGLLASLLGAALIGGVAGLFPEGQLSGLAGASFVGRLFLAATIAGLAGSLLDSWLGAALQAVYHCPACQKETERHPAHICGSPTRRVRGLPWLNNDAVNLAAALAGALTAALLGRLI